VPGTLRERSRIPASTLRIRTFGFTIRMRDRGSHDYGGHNALPASLRMPQRISESFSRTSTRRCLVVIWSRVLEGNADSRADQVEWVGRQGIEP
jgi:hypothetical protein